MKIRFIAELQAANRAYQVGEEIDTAQSVAIRLIERGYAIPVREVNVEFAIPVEPVEMAVKRNYRGRGKRDVGSN